MEDAVYCYSSDIGLKLEVQVNVTAVLQNPFCAIIPFHFQ